MQDSDFGATLEGTTVTLSTPSYRFRLNTASNLRALSWENLLTGQTVDLGGGDECMVELDAADERVWIEGWQFTRTSDCPDNLDEETGFREDYHLPGFDDREWTPCEMPTSTAPRHDNPCVWARTCVFIPSTAREKRVSLVVGGNGMFDYREIRVFVNGHEVGVRSADQRWNEPGCFDLTADPAIADHLRYGLTNIIALQMRNHVTRTSRLIEHDPRGGWHLPDATILATPFEQYIVVGEPYECPELIVENVVIEAAEPECQVVVVEMATPDKSITARVSYDLRREDPVLRRDICIYNAGSESIRLMSLRSGTYTTDADVTDGERGFPVYINGDSFVSLAHSAAWSMGEDGDISLRQYPGVLLETGESYEAAQMVIGAAAKGDANAAFLAHVESRLRRTVRGHDGPKAVLTAFGAWNMADPAGFLEDENSEEILLDHLGKVKEQVNDTGCTFDIYNVDFWVDARGDLTGFDPVRFPSGFDNVREMIRDVGSEPGLWIDSSMSGWAICENPAIARCVTYNQSYQPKPWKGDFVCRATDPARTLYSEGLGHHIRENGVRLLKFDNLRSYCVNLSHDHLPGIYSTEAIHNGVIEALKSFDRESPDVFLMLYWGHRSPWWLLHADTLFEPGLAIEAASPSEWPTLHVRDSVTLGLDLGHSWCRDVPNLGKDSLGVWLSNWGWNSSIGTERWQEGFVMDICRGSLLAQPWSDYEWLTPPERKEMAEFISLLRSQPECFRNSRPIGGDPWKAEPYGYCCTDGDRAFVALNNPTWDDITFDLRLGNEWGLADGKRWNVYRRYPTPARLTIGDDPVFESETSMAMSPFDVVLLEIVPDGDAPTGDRVFSDEPLPTAFAHASTELRIATSEDSGTEHLHLPAEDTPENADENSDEEPVVKRTFTGTCVIPASDVSQTAAISVKLMGDGQLHLLGSPGKYFAAEYALDGEPAEMEAVVHESGYASCWQVWRAEVDSTTSDRTLTFRITIGIDSKVECDWKAYTIPVRN
jgi:hypothetical protein